MTAKTKQKEKLTEAEARDRLVFAALRWREADAGEIGIKRLLLRVNDLASAVDTYEKIIGTGKA